MDPVDSLILCDGDSIPEDFLFTSQNQMSYSWEITNGVNIGFGLNGPSPEQINNLLLILVHPIWESDCNFHCYSNIHKSRS